MSEPELTESAEEPSGHFPKEGLLRRNLPYVAVLTLAIAGVAYTNISHQPLIGFWEFLALAIGFVCVISEWPASQDRRRLLWTQGLHWVTFLITMNIVLLPSMHKMLPAPATSLVLLMLLALGTFLAGVNLLSLRISFLGLALAVAVPAIAWFKQAALFLLLAAVFLIGLGVTFWPRQSDR